MLLTIDWPDAAVKRRGILHTILSHRDWAQWSARSLPNQHALCRRRVKGVNTIRVYSEQGAKRTMPLPSGFMHLFDAVDSLGQGMFGEAWTEDERECRDPPPTLQDVEIETDMAIIDSIDIDRPVADPALRFKNIRAEIMDRFAKHEPPRRRRWEANERIMEFCHGGRVAPLAFDEYSGRAYLLPSYVWAGRLVRNLLATGKIGVSLNSDGTVREFLNWDVGVLGFEILVDRDQIARAQVDSGATTHLTHTGDPGRPSPKNLYMNEYRQRLQNGGQKETLAADAADLRSWVAKQYPGLPLPSIKTITNNIRRERSEFVAGAQK